MLKKTTAWRKKCFIITEEVLSLASLQSENSLLNHKIDNLKIYDKQKKYL